RLRRPPSPSRGRCHRPSARQRFRPPEVPLAKRSIKSRGASASLAIPVLPQLTNAKAFAREDHAQTIGKARWRIDLKPSRFSRTVTKVTSVPGHFTAAAALALGNRPARRHQRGSLLYQSAGDQPQCRTEKILEIDARDAADF